MPACVSRVSRVCLACVSRVSRVCLACVSRVSALCLESVCRQAASRCQAVTGRGRQVAGSGGSYKKRGGAVAAVCRQCTTFTVRKQAPATGCHKKRAGAMAPRGAAPAAWIMASSSCPPARQSALRALLPGAISSVPNLEISSHQVSTASQQRGVRADAAGRRPWRQKPRANTLSRVSRARSGRNSGRRQERQKTRAPPASRKAPCTRSERAP
jgi:hypothetical protein